MKMGEMNCCS